MKGKIHKSDSGWVIEYMVTDHTPIGVKSWYEELRLHPDDVAELVDLSNVFDNIEARVAAYPQVEFEIIEECLHYDKNHFGKDCSCKSGFIQYGKLIK